MFILLPFQKRIWLQNIKRSEFISMVEDVFPFYLHCLFFCMTCVNREKNDYFTNNMEENITIPKTSVLYIKSTQ